MSVHRDLLSIYYVPGTRDITVQKTGMAPALTELRVFGEKGDMNQIITKACVSGLGSRPTWRGPAAA